MRDKTLNINNKTGNGSDTPLYTSDIYETIRKKYGVSKDFAKDWVTAVFGATQETLVKAFNEHRELVITGFGSFKFKHYGRRSIHTGSEAKGTKAITVIPARDRYIFVIGEDTLKKLKPYYDERDKEALKQDLKESNLFDGLFDDE